MQERKTIKNNNNLKQGAGGGNNGQGGHQSGGHTGNNNDQQLTIGGTVLKFEEDVKTSIFNVIYILLKDSDISFWKLTIILIIDFFQILQYSFADVMKSAWKSDDVVYYVSTFLKFTHIAPWMSDLDLTSYLIITYICIGVLVLIILAMVYVSYSFNKTKSSFLWPQKFLRQVFHILVTVLYVPFLELFASMLVCVRQQDNQQSSTGSISNDENTYRQVHSMFRDDLQCWTGLHILHAAFSILSSLILFILSLLVTLTYFKSLHTSTDASAKNDSRADIHNLIQKTIVVYTFTLLGDGEEQHQWFLLAKFTILSAISFERYFILRPYFNESIQRVQNCLKGLVLWANIALVISKLLDQTSFNGGMQIFFMGTPLALALIVFSKDNRRDEMILNASTFQQGEDVAKQIRFFLNVINKRDSGDRNSEIILRGYVYQHEDTCPYPNCQLKLYKRNEMFLCQFKQRKLLKQGQLIYTQSNTMKNEYGTYNQTAINQSQRIDSNQLLLNHAKNMYRIGLQKFPNSASLRIYYAFFLIEKLNKKQDALNELNHAIHLHPTFDEQFIIFRYKKICEEYFDDSVTGGGMVNQSGKSPFADKGVSGASAAQQMNTVDLMTRFAFESSFRQLQMQIEKCAHFHMEFWNLLKDDRPDLGKVGDCGTRINKSIITIEQIWNELQKLNSNVPKALKLYSRYLLEILHDKEAGLEYLQRSKDVANMKQNFFVGNFDNVNDILQVSSDGTPCIMVSGDTERISTITQCNSGAVRVFGYQQFEMKNQKVEKLMPDIYGRNHQKILDDALAKGPENISPKERLVFGRHKSGYIFPVWIQLKLISNMQSEISFIALFKIDKKVMNSNIGFILLNKEKKIQGISSSCMKLMNLDVNLLRRMNNSGYGINHLVPELEYKKDDLLQNKTGLSLEFNVPTFSTKNWKKASNALVERMGSTKRGQKDPLYDKGGGTAQNAKQSQEKKPQQSVTKKKYRFSCTMVTVSMGSFPEIGYYLRLDKLKSDNNTAGIRKKDQLKQPLFQFRFDFFSGRFIREIREGSIANINKNPYFWDADLLQSTIQSDNIEITKRQSQALIALSEANLAQINNDQLKQEAQEQSQNNANKNDPQQPSEDYHTRKKKWGKGIQIYQLRNGAFKHKDYVDEEKRQAELEEERKRKLEENERNMNELANFTNNIKSKKSLRIALNDQRVPTAIRNLRFTMNIVLMILVALAIAEFTVIQEQFIEINENFGMIQRSYKRISEVQRVSYDIRTLILISDGRLKNFQDYTISTVNFTDYLKNDIEQALNSLYEQQDYISLSKLSISDPHQMLINSKVVPMNFKEAQNRSKVINFTLTESVLQMSSAIFTVRHLALNLIKEDQEDVYFMIYNSFNQFLQALLQSSDYYEDELYERSQTKTNLIMTLFLCSIGTVLLSLPILFPAVNSVNKTKERVLTLFIEIPNHFLTELSVRSEIFLSTFYEEQLDEVKSIEENGQNANDEIGSGSGSSSESILQTRRQVIKQPRNTSNTSRQFFFQFSICVLGILAYFSGMFAIARIYISNIEIITKEMSILSFNEAHLAFIHNTQREMVYNANKPILNQNSFDVSKQILLNIQNRVQDYLLLHHDNRGVLNDEYLTTFDQIMNDNLCKSPYLNVTLIPKNCDTLFNDGPSHGLSSILIMYFELLRETLNNFGVLYPQVVDKPSPFDLMKETIFNSDSYKYLYWMQFRFLQDSFRALVKTLYKTTNSDFESTINTKLATFICFIITVAIAYLIFWLPFVSRLNRDIWGTKMMLTIIPIPIILKIPKIQEFLNKQAAIKNNASGKSSGAVIDSKKVGKSTPNG